MLEPTFGASEQPANHPKESRRTHLRGPKHTIYMYLYMSINTIILGWNCCFLGPKKEKAGNRKPKLLNEKRPTPNFIEPWTAELGPVPLLGVPCFLRVHVFVPGCVHLQKSDSKVPRVGSEFGRSSAAAKRLHEGLLRDVCSEKFRNCETQKFLERNPKRAFLH